MSSPSGNSETRRAIVYKRDVRWDIVVPLGFEWKFMEAFGKAFALGDSMEGVHRFRPVDSYYEHPAGYHIQVKVGESEELKLKQFCEEFFGSRSISFRGLDVLGSPATAEQLLTPEGRRVIAENLTRIRQLASERAEETGVGPLKTVTYSTGGTTILANGIPMADVDAINTLMTTSSLAVSPIGG